MRKLIKRLTPTPLLDWYRELRARRERKRRDRVARSLPPYFQEVFRRLLTEEMGLVRGDVVCIHSSLSWFRNRLTVEEVLEILRDVVGREGTLVFPTFPKLKSYEFLLSGQVWDIRHTPSNMGIITEVARKMPDAVRSLHPTKSMCAIGPLAETLTKDHHRSRYPYDACSPYHGLAEHKSKVVGFGVRTDRLSFVHAVDDALKDDFPVAPYHDKVFAAKCIDYRNETVVVETLAHDSAKMLHDVPAFMRNHVAASIARDFEIWGIPFFFADAGPLFETMLNLARDGRTIYPRSVYKT
ncbi:MAG: AAC(3) family N-acetyltransferase [Thermodesulfobacteriota bacterium]